jgi:transcriptional regulator with XRE-family HTH domain
VATDELLTELGDRLRGLRVSQGLTQQDVAEQANVSLGALQHLEQGAPATTLTLAKVLQVLGQEHWVAALSPPPVAFSPLQVLAEHERASIRRAPRVRRSAAKKLAQHPRMARDQT